MPSGGSVSTSFTVVAASPEQSIDVVEDVKIKRPGSAGYAPWRTLTSATGFRATFVPDGGLGTYLLAALARNPASGASSKLSPGSAVIVG